MGVVYQATDRLTQETVALKRVKTAEGLFAAFASLRLEIDEITHFRAGDGVIAVGTATYTMQTHDGATLQLTERWTDLRIQVDGRWVVAMDHVQLVPPAGS